MKAFVGQFVKTSTHNHVGRVKAKHIMFSETDENEQWFNLQRPRIHESAKNEPWYSILCHNGGAVMVPERDLNEVSDVFFDGTFENPWNDFYFKD
jgi:hypothetical protein